MRRWCALALIAGSLSSIADAQEIRRFELALKGGELAKEQRTLKVKQGDTLDLRWTSDRPIRLHLHGYDIEVAVKPDEPAAMALQARIAGRFSVEKLEDKSAHRHGGKVLYLEVHP